MKAVFADTFYYFALLDPHDSNHDIAVDVTRGLESEIVTTAWVLLELANSLSAASHRKVFVGFLDKLRASQGVTIYEADRELFDLGVALYRDRDDKDWSLTDCISFVVMKLEGIDEALTGDRNFEQAGLKALFRQP